MHGTLLEAPQRIGRPSTFSALRHRNYRFYWVGQLFMVGGQNMEWIALAWLVLQLTDSPLRIALTGLAQAGPRIVLGLVGGAIADRVNRQRLIMVTQMLSALLYFALATLVMLEWVESWHVTGMAFLLGCVRSFDGPGRQALLPHMVEREDIPSAVALGNITWELPRLVGPALAGVLIAAVGVGPTLYLAAAGSVAATVLFGLLRVDAAGLVGRGGDLLRNTLDGLRFIRGSQLFYALIGMTFFNSIFGMSYTILLPVFARDLLGVGSQGYGVMQGVSGAGAVAGSFVAPYLARSPHRGLQIFGGATGLGLILMAFAFSPWFALSICLMFLVGVSNAAYMTGISTALQLKVPDDFRARVMGVYGLTWSLMPLGGTITGTIAEFAGPRVAVAAGAFLVAAMAVGLAVALPRVRRLE